MELDGDGDEVLEVEMLVVGGGVETLLEVAKYTPTPAIIMITITTIAARTRLIAFLFTRVALS